MYLSLYNFNIIFEYSVLIVYFPSATSFPKVNHTFPSSLELLVVTVVMF